MKAPEGMIRADRVGVVLDLTAQKMHVYTNSGGPRWREINAWSKLCEFASERELDDYRMDISGENENLSNYLSDRLSIQDAVKVALFWR